MGLMGCGGGCSDDDDLVGPIQDSNPPLGNRVIVTLAGSGTGRVTADPPSTIDCPGTCSEYTGQVTLTAIAAPGSFFAGWSGDCDGAAPCDVSPSAAAGDKRVTARFILSSPGGAVAWDGGGDGSSWTDALNWDADQVPAGNDDVTIDAPGITIRHAADATSFVKTLVSNATIEVAFGILEATNGGTFENLVVRRDFLIMQQSAELPRLRTGSTITVNGILTVSAGTIVGGTLNANGPASFGAISETAEFDGVLLTTSSSFPTNVEWEVCLGTGSTWTIPAGGVVTLDANQFSCLSSAELASNGRLINRGTMRIVRGTVSIDTPFDNEGVVDIVAGGLELGREGNHTGSFIRSNPLFNTQITVSLPPPIPEVVETVSFMAGSTIEAGTVVFESGQAHVGGNYDVGLTIVRGGPNVIFQTGASVSDWNSLQVLSGTLLVESGLDLKFSSILLRDTLNVGHVTGNASVWADQFEFGSGVLKGTGRTVISGGGLLQISGEGTKRITDGHTIKLLGFAAWGGPGLVLGGGASLLEIDTTGTFNIVHQGDLTWDGTAGDGGPMRILNNGILRKDPTSTGTTTMAVCWDNSSTGTVEVLAGNLDIQDQCQ